jgi:fatty acid CoA ligase FadD9
VAVNQLSDLAVKEPRDANKGKRIEQLRAEDAQFRDSFPLPEVLAAKKKPGLRLAEVMKIVMEGYADRPGLGARARELVADASGRKTLRLLPRFDMITYRELWAQARAIASDWVNHEAHPLKAGDFVCILGFTSPDYAKVLMGNIHTGAVNVPLQTAAPPRQHADIMAETEPHILAVGIDYLDAGVDAVLINVTPKRIVVMDYDARDDDQRDKIEAARERLAKAGKQIPVDALADVVKRGKELPAAPLYVPDPEENPLAWLFYTSGSTGTPKGAMLTERLVIGTWLNDTQMPTFTSSFMPMSHMVGNGFLLMALANGGTSYCSPKSDLSTLFEDLSLGRPTMASLVPRVCELLHQHYLSEVDRRIARGAKPEDAERDMKLEMRNRVLGGRLLSVGCGSASLAPETYEFMEDMLGIHMPIGYSSTEIAGGTVLVDWKIQRPPVIDYKLDDVPELGYFNTDKPYPRGELMVKSDRFMAGYYKRPELTAEKVENGYYRTGDIMAQIGPDHLVYLDRRNNVMKLSQGEFVAVSKLEALYTHSPLIQQIYIYGNSERAYLLAVVVPSQELIAQRGPDGKGAEEVKAEIRRSMQQIAIESELNGYEVPRDFLIETEPFGLQNGLLSEIGKHQRPKLKERYGEKLEAMYTQLAQDRQNELRALRASGADRPVIETVSRALHATLGVALVDVRPESKFSELGGDSLSALQFSILLEEIFSIEVPVGVIIGPTGAVKNLAKYIETERKSGAKRPGFAKVHGAQSGQARASDLTLDKFIDEAILEKAPKLPRPGAELKTVLMTGATGFLGRFQALAWLERSLKTGGKVILLARGSDAANARKRIDDTFDTDPKLMQHFQALAEKHLEVLPGDIGEANLGLDEDTWKRLAETVDLIVHPAAHVNHVLPYNQLFAANVAGTAELIRLALTAKLKCFHYISTLGINTVASGIVDEDSDVRRTISVCTLTDGYANGYGISKWAGEVLLREAHDLCGLPVSVFRPGMILAHSRYAGQLNVPDMFTRLLFSLAVTGVAPKTFYAEDGSKGRPKARYDGIAVDYLANAITAIGARDVEGFHTYNLASPPEAGSSLDDIVDWLVEAGCDIKRIDKYSEWLSHFETAMQALPEEQKQESMLAILEPYRKPQYATEKSMLPAERFRAGSAGTGSEILPLRAALIHKYVADLRGLNLL